MPKYEAELEYPTTVDTPDGDELDTTISVKVTHLVCVPPNPNSWSSPEDYYGHSEMEFELYDEDGEQIDEDLLDRYNTSRDQIEDWVWSQLKKEGEAA